MTSTQHSIRDILLTPQQQSLLFAALNSNNPRDNNVTGKPSQMSPQSFTESPSAPTDAVALQDNYLDYDYSFDNADSSFDFSYNNGDGNAEAPSGPSAAASESASPETESPDKRSHPDDDDLDDNGGKRHEGSDKGPKKPGRKPLTSEPTSKRKAQNRAAQRAFRERKEKHLKDLEEKVEELQKASEATNSQNTALRAQVDKMTIELEEYKKKVNLAATVKPTTARGAQFGKPMMSNINDVSFQFEFPKFGQLPGIASTLPANGGLNSMPARSASSSQSPLSAGLSPTNSGLRRDKPSPASSSYSNGLDKQTKEDLANLSGMFSPPLNSINLPNTSRASLDSHFGNLAGASTSSPSASSNSHVGASSSCGTSPEPCTQSPLGFKPIDTLTTIGEEQPSLLNTSQDFGHFANIDFNDVSWLASQNNFQFDPQIFGDYRDPQQNVLTNGGLDDTFFNDAFEVDFTTPYNMPLITPLPEVKKPNILTQIDAAKEADTDDAGALLTCNGIWERLQSCPKVRDGDFDLDGLCADLQKKAKCSGSGAVIDEKDFKHVMGKYLNPDGTSPCPDILKH